LWDSGVDGKPFGDRNAKLDTMSRIGQKLLTYGVIGKKMKEQGIFLGTLPSLLKWIL